MGRSAGVDWATETYEACIVDEGEVVHLELGRLAAKEGLVERLLEVGLCVVAISPNQAKAARSREDLVGVRVEFATQVCAQLEAFYPGAARLFGAVASQIALAFLGRYPYPADARGLGEKRKAASFALAREGYSGDKRCPTAASLAADASQCPVAVELGKRRVAVFRRACDKRLRGAVGPLANSTRQWHPWAEDVYWRARERGADHPHAIRLRGRAWAQVLWRC